MSVTVRKNGAIGVNEQIGAINYGQKSPRIEINPHLSVEKVAAEILSFSNRSTLMTFQPHNKRAAFLYMDDVDHYAKYANSVIPTHRCTMSKLHLHSQNNQFHMPVSKWQKIGPHCISSELLRKVRVSEESLILRFGGQVSSRFKLKWVQ